MEKLSKRALVQNVWSVCMMAFFIIFWTYSAVWGFGWNPFTISCIIASFVYAIWLYAKAIKMFRAVRTLPDSPATESDKRIRKRFRFIFGIEIILITVCSIILSNSILGNPNYILPIITIIVGGHFLPLSVLFHARLLFITGIIMIAAAVSGIILIASGKWINQSIGVCALISAVCVAILSAYVLRLVKTGFNVAKNE